MKLEQQINKYYDSLTPNEQYICECILNHKNDCIRLSIDEFAIKYHISTSGLSRFSQKIQLSGYSELRAVLRLNESNQVKNNKSIDQLMDCYNKVIEDIDQKDCTKIFEKMNSANRIIVFGEDFFQGRVAKEMKRIFLPTGKIIYDAYGHDIIQTLKKFIQEDDIIFYISLNGQSPTIIELAQEMRMRGVKTLKLDIPLVPETRINWAFMPLHIVIIYILKLCLDEEIIPRCRFPCSRGYFKKCIN